MNLLFHCSQRNSRSLREKPLQKHCDITLGTCSKVVTKERFLPHTLNEARKDKG
jgi:hypothetical protein